MKRQLGCNGLAKAATCPGTADSPGPYLKSNPDNGAPLPGLTTPSSQPEGFTGPRRQSMPLSPLGWSIAGRLLLAVAASALLWLAVAWAIGWLPWVG